MKQAIIFILFLGNLSCTTDNSAALKAQKINTNYMDFVLQECEDPDIIEVEHNEDNYSEIDYLCNGKRYEMGVKDNILMFIETSVKLSEIPIDAIRAKLSKNYAEWTIDEAAEIRTADTSFYKLEVIKDGIEQNLYFTKDGKWFKFNALNISDKWDLSAQLQNSNYTKSGYNFFEPEMSYEMPDLLREISGISIKDEETMYCIQDEIGAIFEYNLKKDAITQLHRFTDIGDFEDIAVLKDIIYILRSDGLLFPYDIINKETLQTTMLPLNSLDIEGLCVWKESLYLASKAPQVTQEKHKRTIFKVEEDKLNKPEFFLEIDINEIKTFANEKYASLDLSSLQFNPSALAFHPKTEELYVLSASDKVLTIYKDKKLSKVILLPSNLYYKPEGLAFSANGDLYISSEGDKKGFIKGSIMFFKYSGI